MKKHWFFLTLALYVCFVPVVQAGWQEDMKAKLTPPKNLLQRPTVVAKEHKIMNVTPTSFDVIFVFEVDNPNSFGLDYINVDFNLLIEGNSMGRGKDVKLNIKPKQKTDLIIPVTITYEEFFLASQTLMKAVFMGLKSIPFTFEFTAKIDLKVTTLAIPLKVNGDIPLPGR